MERSDFGNADIAFCQNLVSFESEDSQSHCSDKYCPSVLICDTANTNHCVT
jgi:hypothetical protein